MSQILEQHELLELLDSSALNESEKISLVRTQAKLLRQRELKAQLTQLISAVSAKLEQVINHRAIQQVFSSPLLRH